ncbi:hypothetical protein ACFLZ8_01330 [Planctomycetota bacterium]
MGDVNQLTYVNRQASELQGPFLEVGSKNYGSTQNLRHSFADDSDYVGIDMEAGDGVDKILDLTRDFAEIDLELKHKRFSTIFCLSVLEHCKNPFKMAENLTCLLKDHGKIILSVPFSWKIHAYPDDYWRFTPAAIRLLFPKIEFDARRCVISTSRKGDLNVITDDNIGRISFSFSHYREQNHLLRGISAKLLKSLSYIGMFRWLAGYSYVLAPTNIIMTGTRRD